MNYRYPLLKTVLVYTGAVFLIGMIGLYLYSIMGQQEEQPVAMPVVSVLADGQHYTIRTHGGTVSDLLRQQHIRLADDDLLQPPADTALSNRMTIRITRVTRQESVVLQAVPYETVYYQDPQLAQGQQQIIQAGREGTVRITRLADRNDGITVSDRRMDQQMVQPYIAQVVAVGTRSPAQNTLSAPVLTAAKIDQEEQKAVRRDQSESSVPTAHLSTMSAHSAGMVNPVTSYRYELAAELTAYTAGIESTGKQPGDAGYGVTASGAIVTEGQTVSVDPTVIPMGWWMYIEGVGYRKAEDTGSAIKGNKIDVYMNSLDDARSFGRKSGIKVYVIGPDKPDM
ncbi:G5 and 3D domain-containing protein [Paenibacillus bovis]|uniref:G5 domain-containing protein n=1 Tax=Paenibacillus bovis TaxID=1616788 RepID=A0A172ZEN0_9BACL|nr:3D domain-containing protein [Paenibacillus bovis]ANF96096.1 hypothetical protein AR543_08855 [Paenibacillus bovis]